jgi:hypothetical protein
MLRRHGMTAVCGNFSFCWRGARRGHRLDLACKESLQIRMKPVYRKQITECMLGGQLVPLKVWSEEPVNFSNLNLRRWFPPAPLSSARALLPSISSPSDLYTYVSALVETSDSESDEGGSRVISGREGMQREGKQWRTSEGASRCQNADPQYSH